MPRLKLILSTIAVLFAVQTAAAAEEELFDTSTAAVHFEQGIAHLKAKNLDAAVTEFEEAVSIYPDAENYYYLGYAYYLKGRSGDSESRKSSMENFERAYELDPSFSPTRLRPDNSTQALDAGSDPAARPGQDGSTAPASKGTDERQAGPSEDGATDSPAKSSENIKNISSTSPAPN